MSFLRHSCFSASSVTSNWSLLMDIQYVEIVVIQCLKNTWTYASCQVLSIRSDKFVLFSRTGRNFQMFSLRSPFLIICLRYILIYVLYFSVLVTWPSLPTHTLDFSLNLPLFMSSNSTCQVSTFLCLLSCIGLLFLPQTEPWQKVILKLIIQKSCSTDELTHSSSLNAIDHPFICFLCVLLLWTLTIYNHSSCTTLFHSPPQVRFISSRVFEGGNMLCKSEGECSLVQRDLWCFTSFVPISLVPFKEHLHFK